MSMFVSTLNHIERLPNEVFIGNYIREDFGKPGFRYSRIGQTAYDRNRKAVPTCAGRYPMFVNFTEFENYIKTQLQTETNEDLSEELQKILDALRDLQFNDQIGH